MGRTSGVETRFQRLTKPNFIRLLCGAHQLDIRLQDSYTHFGDDKFYETLTVVIGYRRRQLNLIGDMRSKCLKVGDTRWESMSNISG